MSADFSHVSKGDSPAVMFHADTWNAVLDSARSHQGRLGGETGGSSIGSLSIPSLLIHVENCTGGNLSFMAPVRLDIESYTIDVNFRSRPCYQAKKPTGDGCEVIAILAEPAVGYASGNAANGTGNGIARAWIVGHAIANISITDVSHRFAAAVANDTQRLHSNATFGFPILGEVNATGNLTLGVLLDRQGNSIQQSILRVTGNESGGTYPAIREAIYHAGNLTYTLGNETVRARGVNGEPLANGTYYAEAQLATGTIGNEPLYLVIAGSGNSATGGGGQEGDCGSLVGLSANSCLFTEYTGGTGCCANFTSSRVPMTHSGGVWSGNASLWGLANATVYFTPGNAATWGNPAMWITGSLGTGYLTLNYCGDGSLTFSGGPPFCGNSGNGAGTAPCPPDYFNITADCRCCDPDYDTSGWYCVDDGDGGVACVEMDTCPATGEYIILSGPHADEETCEESCGSCYPCSCLGDGFEFQLTDSSYTLPAGSGNIDQADTVLGTGLDESCNWDMGGPYGLDNVPENAAVSFEVSCDFVSGHIRVFVEVIGDDITTMTEERFFPIEDFTCTPFYLDTGTWSLDLGAPYVMTFDLILGTPP